jgi:hypothetical protein
MKVVMLPDWHGVEESVKLQIEELKKLKNLEQETTMVLHEPIPSDLRGCAQKFSAGIIGFETFWRFLNLEKHWGPSDSYADLYTFLKENEIGFGSLDYSLSQRKDLASRFKSLVLDFREKRFYVDLDKRFSDLKREISFGREELFCKEVDEKKYSGVERAVVVTHPAHIDRCASYFRGTQCYEVFVYPVDPALAERLSREEEKLQLEYARRNNITYNPEPPLVPVVSLAWKELSEAAKIFEKSPISCSML